MSTFTGHSHSKKKADQTSNLENKAMPTLKVKDRAAQINKELMRFRWWVHQGSEATIKYPTLVTPENEKIEIGELYFYCTTSHTMPYGPANYQAWMFVSNTWVDITTSGQSDDGLLRHPLDRSHILSHREDGTPSYIAESTWKKKVRDRKRILNIEASVNGLSISG